MLETNSMKGKTVFIEPEIYEDLANMVAEKIIERMLQEESEWAKGLEWICQQTGGSKNWVKDKILYPFRHELEGIVEYPENQGQHWRFNKHHVKQWLRNKNFKELK